MSKNVEYAFTIDLPIDKDTSKLYTPDTDQFGEIIIDCIEKIQRAIRARKTISLGRIFRCFEMAESPKQPYIFFDFLDSYEVEADEDGYIVTLYLYGACEQDPVSFKSKIFKPYLMNPEEENQRLDEPVVTKRDENGKPVAGRYPWNAGTLQKEPGADTDGDEIDLAKPDSQEKQGL